jgi:ferredoxin-fold anticodon binding domain-containing protein
MKLLYIFVILLIISISIFLLLYKNNIIKNNSSISPITSSKTTTTQNNTAINNSYIESNIDTNARLSYYNPLGFQLSDFNFISFATTREGYSLLNCLDQNNTFNNPQDNVKLKNCNKNYSQFLKIKDETYTIKKIYSSLIEKCLTKINDNKLIFDDCKTEKNAIQQFSIINNRIAYNNGSQWLTIDISKNVILTTDKSRALTFQLLNFNQVCNSNLCTNITKINDLILFLDTTGIMYIMLEQTDPISFEKFYTSIWNNKNQIELNDIDNEEKSKFKLSFNNTGDLRVTNTSNNNKIIWSISSFYQKYKNSSVSPFRINLISNYIDYQGYKYYSYSIFQILDGNNDVIYEFSINTPEEASGGGGGGGEEGGGGGDGGGDIGVTGGDGGGGN